MTFVPTTMNCDNYAAEREGKYEYRAVRYRAAIELMKSLGLDDTMTIVDVGAGMTEFDYCLRREYNWRGRYIPIDGGIDGTDLNVWTPPRDAHWFVALEIFEHLTGWKDLVYRLKGYAQEGIVASTPDPNVCDVIAMDPTHVTEINWDDFHDLDFYTEYRRFYGGTYGETAPGGTDALLAHWRRNG